MAKLPNNYFPHDFNARHDRKILRLRKVLGLEGYGIFWMLVETLCTEENFSYPIAEIDLLADDYGCSTEKVAAVIKQFGLFQIDKDGCFFSLSLITRLQKYLDISEKARLSVNKRWDKARKLKELDTSVLPPYNEGNTIRGEERKEKKRKEDEMKESPASQRFEHPSKEKVISAFTIAGYPEDEAKKFFGHYDSKDWADAKGNPIVYWGSLIEKWMLGAKNFMDKTGVDENIGLTYDQVISRNGGKFKGWNKKEDGLWYKN